jgi:hypothetical protein
MFRIIPAVTHLKALEALSVRLYEEQQNNGVRDFTKSLNHQEREEKE